MIGPVTSLKSTALSQKYVRNVCHRSNKYLTKFILIVFRIQKHKCNFHYVAIPMMTSHILKSANSTKRQKSRYLKNKKFFLQKNLH